MRVLKQLLFLSVTFASLAAHAAGEAPPESVAPPNDQSPSAPADRPQREAVKISPSIRALPPPDAGDRRRRVAPAGADSPLQDVPALKDVTPPGRGEPPVNR
jgi:hypothetical protein